MPKVCALALLPLLGAGVAGCGAVRGMINTQPVVELRKEDLASPEKIVGGTGLVYEPSLSDSIPAGDQALLARYAPVLVQGILPPDDNDYERASDEIGRPHLATAPEGQLAVTIDTADPQVFARVEKETVQERELTQLVYVFWYPRRPVGMVQKGDVDGGVFRVTLDAAGRKAVYEYSQTCGCLHGVFVSEHVEAWASREFPTPDPGRKRFCERKAEGKASWVVRDVVHSLTAEARPVLFVSAGGHECVSIQTSESVTVPAGLPHRGYALAPYEALTALPVDDDGGRTASMFNADGLVWGGKRGREEVVFADLDHPGWPRHLDRMKISWDESLWTDPTLIETFLKIPKQMVNPEAPAARLDGAMVPAPKAAEALPPAIADALKTGKPVAVLFTHEFCGGCQYVESEILPNPELQQVIARWAWVEAHMEKPEGEDLAGRYRVDQTPTLMILDDHGAEVRRIGGISTLKEFWDALQR